MKTTIHASELSSLVKRLNFEIQNEIINAFGASPGLDHVISWSMVGDDECLEIRGAAKMVEIRSIVVPADFVDCSHYSISLSGARVEVAGKWSMFSGRHWLCDTSFGETGTLVLTLPSLEPEDVQKVATALAEEIGKYLDAEIEIC
jgi:hypothetical protein